MHIGDEEVAFLEIEGKKLVAEQLATPVKIAPGKGGAGAVIGGTTLGILGSHVGVAAFGTAISGLWPLAALGAVVGYLVAKE